MFMTTWRDRCICSVQVSSYYQSKSGRSHETGQILWWLWQACIEALQYALCRCTLVVESINIYMLSVYPVWLDTTYEEQGCQKVP